MLLLACAEAPTASQSAAPAEPPKAAVTKAPAAETTAAPEQPAAEDSASQTEVPTAEPTEEPAPHKTVLVVVFSATGTTKGVAEKIAAIEDADLYEILAAEPYSDADLNWHDSNSRTTKEQNDSSVRPAIASETLDLTGYERIYVGYPIWWGEEPRILDTFVESYDFGSAVMIPFCTSASSGLGRSGKNLADHANGGSWLDGKRFSGSVSESDLANWINGLK
ncbi:MAG: flavodoxin [Clostridia bacterium]|nr:flavodoxin [Clostridia bacterium]